MGETTERDAPPRGEGYAPVLHDAAPDGCGHIAFYLRDTWRAGTPMPSRDVLLLDGTHPAKGTPVRCGHCGRPLHDENLIRHAVAQAALGPGLGALVATVLDATDPPPRLADPAPALPAKKRSRLLSPPIRHIPPYRGS